MFFSMLIFWFSRLSRGWKGKRIPKCQKKFSVAPYISGTIYHMIFINGTHVCTNVQYLQVLFFSKFWYLGSLGGWGWGCKRTKNGPKWQKNFVCLTPYLRNCTSYDCKFWGTCLKWSYLQHIFSFFKILILGGFREIKGKKWSKITNFSLFSSISQEL